MVKLQAVQGVVNAVSTVANNLNKDAILGIQLRNGLEKLSTFIKGGTTTAIVAQTTASGGLATAQGAVTTTTVAASAAMKAFRIALIATGIGAIVVLLGLAAEAMGFFGDESEDAAKQQEKLKAQLDATKKSLQEQQEATNELIQSVEKDTARLVAQAKLRGDSEKEVSRIKSEQSALQRRFLANDVESAKNAYYKTLNDMKATLDQLIELEGVYFGSK
jgi:membrane protein involved in colicin uptake